MYRALIVGGAFDNKEGCASGIVNQLSEHTGWSAKNGGNLSALSGADYDEYDAVVWMPETCPDSVSRTATQGHAFSLLDPLGNQYCNMDSIAELAWDLKKRVHSLCSLANLALETNYSRQSFAFREAGYLLVFRRHSEKADVGKRSLTTALFARDRGLGNASVVVPIQMSSMKCKKETDLALCGRVYVKGAPVASIVSLELVEGFGGVTHVKGVDDFSMKLRRTGIKPRTRSNVIRFPLTNQLQALAS